MRYFTLIILSVMTLSSCGKSPLLNKFKAPLKEVSGGVLLLESFPKEKVEFSFKWITPPDLENLGSFEIELKNPLKDSMTLNAYLWMPEMGHGSSPIEMAKVNSENYLFTELAFIMPGVWVLHVQILENNQVVDEWQKSVVL